MPVWTNNEFEGMYPVGSAAVVVADTPEEAAAFLSIALHERWHGKLPGPTPTQMKELPIKNGEVRILCDGNY